jgi:C1A family cysteine protease
VLFIPNRKDSTDNDGIKQAIQNYGALYTTMYYDNTFYSSAKKSYYYTGTSSSNHAVDIVGWNDSYDKSKFVSTPPGNGAFIVRNS